MTGASERLMSAPDGLQTSVRSSGDGAASTRYEPEADLVSRREYACSIDSTS